MANYDPERDAHKAWLGLIQPVGLVVAPPALIKAQVVLDHNVVPIQQALQAVVERPPAVYTDPDPVLADFPRFATEVLGWAPEDLAGVSGGPEIPERLCVHLPDYGETLRPTYAAVDTMGDDQVLMLVSVVDRGASLDKPPQDADRHGWQASPQARLERLLRDTAVPAGLLCNGVELRLVYAPRGESSGHLGFPVAEMCTVGGRPLLAAMHMLLCEHRLFGAGDGQRLLDLLAESRKYQSEVSNRLSEQVLGALWELLRGFQAADEAANRCVLFDLPREDPNHIYGGLLTVIMRLVFLLYAEDRGLMPDDPVYARNYAVGGLYERLREDAGRYPDTMDQRYGGWAWLLSTFRLIFDGGGHAGLRLPTRHGQLFNPDEYPFLEGRPIGVGRVMGEIFEAPRLSDGVLWRVLEGLLVLDGERLSYRALDVEQIGSVYESMMGFEVETTAGRAVAVRPKHIVVDLDALLEVSGGKRSGWLKEHGDCDLSGRAATDLADAETVNDLVAALGRRLSPQTPRPLAPGALILQPGEERRRSGSHYTPRELTEPIVRTTLRPVLEALGERPTPEQILDLKVCDPAMGSGAFLVEACRQLADAVVRAWEVHDCMPMLPPDEDPLLHARRLVAQRCLYGVDKNPFAVNLAKLSLWLVTLARDHAFTFIDHALKHGDSLVGLTREQIVAFHWQPESGAQIDWIEQQLRRDLEEALGWRREIQSLAEGDYDQRRAAWREAEDALHHARLVGDLCIASFFGAEKDKDREALRQVYRDKVEIRKRGQLADGELLGIAEGLRAGDRAVPSLHWEIEFPEVFWRENPGFDGIVGNPPFLGGRRISTSFGDAYKEHLVMHYTESNANTDLSAFFFRQAFDMLRPAGAFGLVATNTIAQGDTRATGLRYICMHGGTIIDARRRFKWPGLAAVTVAIVVVRKGRPSGPALLDGRRVERISAFLADGAVDSDPMRLTCSHGLSFQGTVVVGKGFLFSDDDSSTTPLREMQALLARNPGNTDLIKHYVSGSDLCNDPRHRSMRWIIDFGNMSILDAERWPDLLSIVRAKVKPQRDLVRREAHRQYWWQFGDKRPELYSKMRNLVQVLANSQVSTHFSFAFLPADQLFSHSLNVFPSDTYSAFCSIQSRPHEVWARFFGSSLEDRLRYTPSDCFETFPFPHDWQANPSLEAAGQIYYDFRAALMIRNDEGLTKTYNRFHDPDERSPGILKLRELHAAMDRAVLDCYGWTDVPTDCDFFLDYEIDEEAWGTKKKPYRYRWPDEVHDDVLARLLDLNQKRYAEEVAAGLHDTRKKNAAPKKASEAKKAPTAVRAPLPLFAGLDDGGES